MDPKELDQDLLREVIAEVVAASKENPYLVEAIKKATKATDTAEDGDGITDTATEGRQERTDKEKDSGKVVGERKSSPIGDIDFMDIPSD